MGTDSDAVKFIMIASDKKVKGKTDIIVVEISSFNIIISNHDKCKQSMDNQPKQMCTTRRGS